MYAVKSPTKVAAIQRPCVERRGVFQTSGSANGPMAKNASAAIQPGL